jgi:predicted transposase/invertase (TIGR01784 family)
LIFPSKFDDDIIEHGKKDAKCGFDEWVYVLKNSKVREDFTAAGVQLAGERLNVLKMTHEEREAYRHTQAGLEDYKSQLLTSKIEGEEIGEERGVLRGRAEGRTEAREEIARNLKADGMPFDKIAVLTGLSVEDIELL